MPGGSCALGPIAFWVVVGTLVIMAVWTITTATYFAFRDDVLTGLIARQAEMQYGYEDRIADLRAQIDRMSSRQLLNQEQYEQKLDQIMRRQTALESRANALQAMPDSIVTGSTRPTGARTDALGAEPAVADQRQVLEPAAPRPRSAATAMSTARSHACRRRSIASKRGRRRSLYVHRGELRSQGATHPRRPGRARPRRRTADRRAAPRSAARWSRHGCRPMPASFERMSTASASRAPRSTGSRATLASVPVRRPVMGEIEISSGFGMRIDPFIRAPAMHTGLDFRGDTGDPVRATADGNVTVAGWNGGYGKMVEIDHGNGLATRYGASVRHRSSRSGSG